MKNMFKKSLAAVMAVASLAVGMTSVAASAAKTSINSDTSVVVDADSVRASKSFSFETDSYQVTTSFKISSTCTVTASFGHTYAGYAKVTLMKSGGGAVGAFVIPASAGTTLSYPFYNVAAGDYYFKITPDNCDYTSGSFSITY